MSSALSFVPRKFAKSSRNRTQQKTVSNGDGQTNDKSPETACPTPSPGVGSQAGTTSIAPLRTGAVPSQSKVAQEEEKGKGKARADERGLKFTDVDYAHLVCLALSDYALWLDPDMRRALDPSQKNEAEWNETGPYISINNVFKRFLPSFGVDSPPMTSVVGIVKVLRACAAELVDTRLLLLEEPSLASDGWRGAGAGGISSKSLGGYELRRKDWTRGNIPEGFSCSKRDWDERTIYVEHIPVHYRSVPGVLRLITGLLAEDPSSNHPLTRIQGVTLPAHHQDKSGDPPIFKDFCLVTFTASEDVEFFTKHWPWARRPTSKTRDSEEDSDAVKEANKFGFRALTKTNWERLRQEYLGYRMRLIKEISEHQDTEAEAQTSQKRLRKEATPEQSPPAKDSKVPPKVTMLSPDAPYPYGCLIFVRNIHPETNKTTLRTLFSTALKEGGLDYVDFNKGMDSCHLRLSTPSHADILVSHFEDSIIQAYGLDDKGTSVGASSSGTKPIVLEKLLGKREEVYWERVPKKVREQAVKKAIILAGVDESMDKDQSNPDTGLSRRKRRKN